MHRVAVAVALGATACFQPVAATGVPCSLTRKCPTGQHCDLSADAPTCVLDAVDGGIADDATHDGAPRDASIDAAPVACPATYMPYNGSATSYRVVTKPETWETAAADCASDAPGATHLVVVSNETERMQIGLALGPRWIGLTDRRLEGSYRWVTGEATAGYPPASGPPWGLGQPSGGPDINCVFLNGLGGFDDERCVVLFPYICECDAYADDPTRY